jgi:hypothetical protein
MLELASQTVRQSLLRRHQTKSPGVLAQFTSAPGVMS